MEADYSDILEEEERARQIGNREDEEERMRQREVRKRIKYKRLLEAGEDVLLGDVSSDPSSDEGLYWTILHKKHLS